MTIWVKGFSAFPFVAELKAQKEKQCRSDSPTLGGDGERWVHTLTKTTGARPPPGALAFGIRSRACRGGGCWAQNQVVICPIWLLPYSQNQIFLSGPAVIPTGSLSGVRTGNSVI
jgi:hypothetical protein